MYPPLPRCALRWISGPSVYGSCRGLSNDVIDVKPQSMSCCSSSFLPFLLLSLCLALCLSMSLDISRALPRPVHVSVHAGRQATWPSDRGLTSFVTNPMIMFSNVTFRTPPLSSDPIDIAFWTKWQFRKRMFSAGCANCLPAKSIPLLMAWWCTVPRGVQLLVNLLKGMRPYTWFECVGHAHHPIKRTLGGRIRLHCYPLDLHCGGCVAGGCVGAWRVRGGCMAGAWRVHGG